MTPTEQTLLDQIEAAHRLLDDALIERHGQPSADQPEEELSLCDRLRILVRISESVCVRRDTDLTRQENAARQAILDSVLGPVRQ